MRTMGIKRRITLWRKRADMVEGLVDKMPPGTRLEARGYVEAMRECANQLELSVVVASQPETLD